MNQKNAACNALPGKNVMQSPGQWAANGLQQNHKEEQKMKVAFENRVSTYSGKYKEVVYQSWFAERLCYARKYTYPVLGITHETMAAISKNLYAVYLLADADYVKDFKTYSQKNTRENLPKVTDQLHKIPSSKSLFIHCMWCWYDSDPTHIDLKTVTIQDMVTLGSPVCAVKKCVDAGNLKRVSGYETLVNPINGV